MSNKEFSRDSQKESPKGLGAHKLRQMFLAAVLGAGFLTGCGIDDRAKANIAAAGVSPEVANDPDLIWFAANGASPDEIRDYANNLMKNEALLLNNAEEMSVDLETPADDFQNNNEENIERFSLEKIAEGVYSFKANDNIEVTSQLFIKQLRESLGQAGGVFFAIVDNNTGITMIFTDSTVDNYEDEDGNKIFYAYPGDTVYVSTSGQALNDFLDSENIEHKFVGLP